MKAGIIHLDYVEIMGVALREIIEKLLEVVGVHARIFLKKERTSDWLYRPIQIKGFELPLDFDVGFDFFQRDAAAGDRLQAESTFVLRPVANI